MTPHGCFRTVRISGPYGYQDHVVVGVGVLEAIGAVERFEQQPMDWYVEPFEQLANVATKAGVEGAGIRIHAPLMDMSKADIAREGQRLGIDFAQTVSCYNADPHGRACGHCDACQLRAQGFREAGLPDPTRYA